MAHLLHNMLRVMQYAAMSALVALASTSPGSAETHIAAVTRNSLPPPSKDARKLPIDIASSEIVYKDDAVVLQNVVITQGETRVQADRAHTTGLDTENSRWTFEGNVRINGEQHGTLKSDVAIVEFRNKDIAKATATGNPAEFEQKRSDIDETARGHAKEIVYDVNDGTVRLSNDAWLWDGRNNSLSAPELVYDIRQQHVRATADPGGGNQVHLRIDPNAHEDPNKKP